MANRVVPVAPRAFHVDQRVFVRAALASAQEMTKLLGRDTVAPLQARTFTAGDFTCEATALAATVRAGTASAPAMAMGVANRARRDMKRPFIVLMDIFGDDAKERSDASGSGATSHLDIPGDHAKLKVLRVKPWP